jgi:hypothetical protein
MTKIQNFSLGTTASTGTVSTTGTSGTTGAVYSRNVGNWSNTCPISLEDCKDPKYFQNRKVTCMMNGNLIVDDDMCDEKLQPRPLNRRNCLESSYCKFKWKVYGWERCNNNGEQKRTIECMDRWTLDIVNE